LSALLLTTVYWTYFSIYRSIEVVTEGQEVFEAGRTLVELVKKDIRGMVPGKYPLVGKTETVEGAVLGDISFVTTSRLGTGPLTLRKVGYTLIRTDQGEKLLIRRESRDLKAEITDGTGTELSRLVASFDIGFYNGTEWMNQWDSGVTNTLPKQIRLTFDFVEGKGRVRTFYADEVIASTL
jgi:hypothetical protein